MKISPLSGKQASTASLWKKVRDSASISALSVNKSTAGLNHSGSSKGATLYGKTARSCFLTLKNRMFAYFKGQGIFLNG